MKTESLTKIFSLTAALSFLVVVVALRYDFNWALRYGVLSLIAGLNWFGLSLVLLGATRKSVASLVFGFCLKGCMLVTFLVACALMGFEVTSFLAALNTFFVAFFLYSVTVLLPVRRLALAQTNLEGRL